MKKTEEPDSTIDAATASSALTPAAQAASLKQLEQLLRQIVRNLRKNELVLIDDPDDTESEFKKYALTSTIRITKQNRDLLERGQFILCEDLRQELTRENLDYPVEVELDLDDTAVTFKLIFEDPFDPNPSYDPATSQQADHEDEDDDPQPEAPKAKSNLEPEEDFRLPIDLQVSEVKQILPKLAQRIHSEIRTRITLSHLKDYGITTETRSAHEQHELIRQTIECLYNGLHGSIEDEAGHDIPYIQLNLSDGSIMPDDLHEGLLLLDDILRPISGIEYDEHSPIELGEFLEHDPHTNNSQIDAGHIAITFPHAEDADEALDYIADHMSQLRIALREQLYDVPRETARLTH